MQKKKPFLPKDIKDLESIYYDLDRGQDRKRYESHLQDTIFSPDQESEVKELLGQLGTCTKLPRQSKKTFDFKIDETKLLVEVTSINPPLAGESIKASPNYVLSKIRTAIEHAEEKESSLFPGYEKGIIIFCSSILLSLTNIWPLLSNRKFISELISSKLDYVIFIAQRASISMEDSRKLYPTLIFVKSSALSTTFKTAFQNNSVIYEIPP